MIHLPLPHRLAGCPPLAMIQVTARQGEGAERLLQRFKRICVKEGLFRELKRRKHFEKPSVKRRREEKERRRAARKAAGRKAMGARSW